MVANLLLRQVLKGVFPFLSHDGRIQLKSSQNMLKRAEEFWGKTQCLKNRRILC
jgi:hypothetical protein